MCTRFTCKLLPRSFDVIFWYEQHGEWMKAKFSSDISCCRCVNRRIFAIIICLLNDILNATRCVSSMLLSTEPLVCSSQAFFYWLSSLSLTCLHRFCCHLFTKRIRTAWNGLEARANSKRERDDCLKIVSAISSSYWRLNHNFFFFVIVPSHRIPLPVDWLW